MTFPKFNKPSGFSLVELMVVVAIIGILSSIAIPRFRIFQSKAKQSEAKTILANIYTLEMAFQGENDTFSDLAATGQNGACPTPANPLGFYLTPCDATKSRYTFSVTGSSTTAFTANAVSGAGPANRVAPGCPAETWSVTQDKVLSVTGDVVKTCNN